MLEGKEKTTLNELLQFAFDRRLVKSVNIQLAPEFDHALPGLCTATVHAITNWFDSNAHNLTPEQVTEAKLRFCLTAGMGAMWLLMFNPAPPEADALLKQLAGPRGIFAMDEYVEDLMGICFEANSHEHKRLLRLFHDSMDMLSQHYQLQNQADAANAALVMTYFGAMLGIVQAERQKLLHIYLGEEDDHSKAWTAFYGSNTQDEQGTTEFQTQSQHALTQGEPYVTRELAHRHDLRNGTYAKTYSTCQAHIYPADALSDRQGRLRVTTVSEIDTPEIKVSTPEFDSSYNTFLEIDEVQVWSNGLEATIAAHDDEDGSKITFYDTNYMENKDLYWCRQTYVFDIYGIVLDAELAPADSKPYFRPRPDKPEQAEFCGKLLDRYRTTHFLGKEVIELETELPFRNNKGEVQPMEMSIFVATSIVRSKKFRQGNFIKGHMVLQGKMKQPYDMQERPSSVLHSLIPTDPDGHPMIFEHRCRPEQAGQPMTASEQHLWAKSILKRYLADRVDSCPNEPNGSEKPDFCAEGHRLIWVRADAHHNPQSLFSQEDVQMCMQQYYYHHNRPVLVYVTLRDLQGNPCQWVKGASYTVELHYGSALPGQRMPYPHTEPSAKELMTLLLQAFDRKQIWPVADYLHKDVEFKSVNRPGVLINKEEAVSLIASIDANLRDDHSHFKGATLETDSQSDYRIRLEYATSTNFLRAKIVTMRK